MVDDLVRSVIVKIFQSVKGGDVERNTSSCLRLLTLSSSLYSLFIYLHTYIVYILQVFLEL